MSDYHYRKIVGKDKRTGWPVDEYGHILNKRDRRGKEARDLTSPYGSLEFAIGSGDDFWCFDYGLIEDKWMALHAAINSETGGFIMDASDGYEVVTLANAAEVALGMIDRARDWCYDNGIRHSRKGWNQDELYFYRSVYLAIYDIHTFPDRQKRFGGKRITAFCKL